MKGFMTSGWCRFWLFEGQRITTLEARVGIEVKLMRRSRRHKHEHSYVHKRKKEGKKENGCSCTKE